MKHIVYCITYTPHLNTELPKYYIGSKYNYYDSYLGSVSSNKSREYTEGMTLKQWWKIKTKETPEDFIIEILEFFDKITPNELTEIELKYQKQFDIKSSDYFNSAYANGNFVSKKNSQETKALKSKRTKEYWNSERSKDKREKLIQFNKSTKSDWLKQKILAGEFDVHKGGRKKGSKNKPGYKLRKSRNVKYENMIFNDAYDASKYLNLHPVSIRRKCKYQVDGWTYC